MTPILTEVVGVPYLPPGAADLHLSIIFDPPYRGGPNIGLSAAQYEAVRSADGTAWVFDSPPGGPFFIPLARTDVFCYPPEGWLRAIITYTWPGPNGQKRRTEPRTYVPIAGSDGKLDLSVNQNPAGLAAQLSALAAMLASGFRTGGSGYDGCISIAGSDFNVLVGTNTTLGTPPEGANRAIFKVLDGDIYASTTGATPGASVFAEFDAGTHADVSSAPDLLAFRASVKSGTPRLVGYFLACPDVGSGMGEVIHDATLHGKGTTADPLGLSPIDLAGTGGMAATGTPTAGLQGFFPVQQGAETIFTLSKTLAVPDYPTITSVALLAQKDYPLRFRIASGGFYTILRDMTQTTADGAAGVRTVYQISPPITMPPQGLSFAFDLTSGPGTGCAVALVQSPPVARDSFGPFEFSGQLGDHALYLEFGYGGDNPLLLNKLPLSKVQRGGEIATALDTTLPGLRAAVEAPTSYTNLTNVPSTFPPTPEAVQDIVGALLQASGSAGVTYDDAANTLTISAPAAMTQEQVEDIAANLLRAGSNVTVTYDDAAGALTITGTASGGGGTASLSAQAGGTTVGSQRNPATAATETFNGLAAYGKFTPTADFIITGLRDDRQFSGVGSAPKIFRVSDGALLASGPEVQGGGAGTSRDYLFTGPVTLAAGVPVYIGFQQPNDGYIVISNNSPVATSWPGMTVASGVYSGNFPNAPVNFVPVYLMMFSLLSQTTGRMKTVIGPVDPLDMPVVTAVSQLANSTWALLDDGTNPPRIVRRRADGTVFYGPLFSTTP